MKDPDLEGESCDRVPLFIREIDILGHNRVRLRKPAISQALNVVEY